MVLLLREPGGLPMAGEMDVAGASLQELRRVQPKIFSLASTKIGLSRPYLEARPACGAQGTMPQIMCKKCAPSFDLTTEETVACGIIARVNKSLSSYAPPPPRCFARNCWTERAARGGSFRS
jgi:hypothetical protein